MDMKRAIREHLDTALRALVSPPPADGIGAQRARKDLPIPEGVAAWLRALRADIRTGKAGTPIRLALIGHELGAPEVFWPLILDALDAEDVCSDDGSADCARVLRTGMVS